MTRPSRSAVGRSLSTRHPRPPAPGGPRVSLVLPTYREDRIGDSIRRVRDELGPLVGADGLEIIVVDDGSADGSAESARAAGADRVIEFAVNRGKGAAVRAGVLAATGRTVAFTDADLSYAPWQVMRLVEEVEDGWDMVVGSRYHRDTTTVVQASALRTLGGRAINAATRLVLAGRHADTQCGLKAFRSDVAVLLFGHTTIDGFAFDVELFLGAERAGLSLAEVPVAVENSERSTVNVGRDALRLLADLARIRRAASAGAYDLSPAELAGLTPAGE